MKRIIFYILISILSISAMAQKPADEGRLVRYQKDICGGFILHTEGWGGYFRYGQFLTYNKRIQYSVDLVSMHHAKEVKVFNPNFDDGKGYFFGKLNSMYILRPGIGLKRIYFEKLREKGVEISLNYSLGPSIGFLKPVYLQILYPTQTPFNYDIFDERYNPSEHTIDNIYGRSKGAIGIGDTKITPGAFVKVGAGFEFANIDDLVRAFEVGGILDYYVKPVELMANNPSSNFFLSLYFKFIFGRKYF